jgi:DNA-binding YbaB/EbfC family protein
MEGRTVNIGNIMKQAQKMQAEMARVQEELKDEQVEASAGGGTVKVVMSGDVRVLSVTVDPSAVDPEDIDLLQDMIAAAVNEGIRMAQELASQKMAAVTGGMNLPGMGM